tara:strand:- start:9884 stop:10156 length:273 start_codon:yes stop_codon:yes gene_type:complete
MLALGEIAFFEVAEPILAFRRDSDAGAMLCIFNLSAADHAVAGTDLPAAAGLEAVSERAVLDGEGLHLSANGYAFIAIEGTSKAAVSDLA